ncbi:anti-sigma factor [Halovulum dunhuangense]|uniref:Regulator of SigK n=1 Tax=Halovulum dunhuangense TaxID=1505036 RepID=A0A849KPA8_9RHOB|nr:anti-sigma factor [Halovulum dunhuangense]NNU78873.1 anti-sigma factor [Halovulum dunhuangense]
MTANGQDLGRSDDALAAEYALGVLPHAERVVFAMRLEHSAALRERVRFWEERLAVLSDDISPVPPPSRVLDRTERRLFGVPEKRSGWWNSVGLWRGLSFASLVAALGLGFIAWQELRTPGQAGPGAAYVAELRGDTGAVSLMALFDEGTGTLRINRTAGDATVNRVFQLWLIAGDNPPVSLGLLPQDDATGVITIPEDIRDDIGDGTLAISDEPEGGSPTGQPTGDVLALGQMAPI